MFGWFKQAVKPVDNLFICSKTPRPPRRDYLNDVDCLVSIFGMIREVYEVEPTRDEIVDSILYGQERMPDWKSSAESKRAFFVLTVNRIRDVAHGLPLDIRLQALLGSHNSL